MKVGGVGEMRRRTQCVRLFSSIGGERASKGRDAADALQVPVSQWEAFFVDVDSTRKWGGG